MEPVAMTLLFWMLSFKSALSCFSFTFIKRLFCSSSLSVIQFSLVQSLSHVRLLATPWITACQASLSITNSRSSLKLMSIEAVMPSSHLILCCPLLLPSIPPTIRVFSNESTLHMRWPKYWSFISSISPSNEHPGLISFRRDWLDLLAVQGTLKSLLQQLEWSYLNIWGCWYFSWKSWFHFVIDPACHFSLCILYIR